MRISWLDQGAIVAARDALRANAEVWDEHFTPTFRPPPRPNGIAIRDWERVTEHVARAERVSAVVRDFGLDEARSRFGASPFAIEQATLAAAAHQGDELDFDMVASVLSCEIDALVFYAPFLELLLEMSRGDRDRALVVYERFSTAYAAVRSSANDWRERVGAVRDGLASAYVDSGRLDEGHALFVQRHDEDRDDAAVALSASRAFLAAGAVARAVHWLGVGVERAEALGRPELAEKLRGKITSLRQRLS